MSTTQTSYDTVDYPGFTYPDTHPDHLAAMALLHGLEPAPVGRCRVLEVGCNEGANLIPMAYAIPDSQFVGFDLAGTTIARGEERIRALELRNIRLFQADLLNIDPELGKFDYIVAHGLYAWIPDPVRDGLLALCKRHLSPNGVVFISYNALPGGHIRRMLRDMMHFRANGLDDPHKKIDEALDLLHMIVKARPESDAYRHVMEDQLKRLRKGRTHSIYHDDLSPFYKPVNFAEFVQHAAQHGLQYLSEATLPGPRDPSYNPEFVQSVRNIAGDDVIAQEQLFDFARIRMYRQTLLCHADQKLRRDFPAEVFPRFLFASSAVSEEAEASGARVYTLSSGDINLTCNQPATIAVMEQLITLWPHTLTFDQIVPTLLQNGVANPRDAAILLMQMAVAQMIELHTWQAPVTSEISEWPRATKIGRMEAYSHEHASTLWHFTLELTDPVGRSFLQLLDGTRDRKALLDAMKMDFPDMPVDELETGMERNLKFLYRAALLEA